MSRPGYIRRRPAGVLVAGLIEPEVQPWLRAAGHAPLAARRVDAALAAIGSEPIDLVIVDREPAGVDAAGVCRALRADARLDGAWMLAITGAGRGSAGDDVLQAGADDYLRRPFSRLELLARVGTGLRAAQQRADDDVLRSLMVNVPGAIYRSAWHAGFALELISDEIERISGYPAANFLASERRTILSIVHPGDREAVERAIAETRAQGGGFAVEYRIVRPDGTVRWVLDRGQLVPGAGDRLWLDGALFDVTERRAAEQALRRREVEQARTAELRASLARVVEAGDTARRKIERDLHDGAQQRLVALALDVRMARARVRREPETAGPFLDGLGDELSQASAELRELARGIHPAVLTERGLADAVAALAARAPVPVELLDVPDGRLAPPVEIAAYFTVSEALTNVAKYARASHATVRLATGDGALVIEVADDGVGGAGASAGSGLSGLGDRVGALQGSLTVTSPPGKGTVVRAVLPLAS